MNKLLFTDLAISPQVLKAIVDMGFEEATPIQSLSIPTLLKGKDVIGQAQTGRDQSRPVRTESDRRQERQVVLHRHGEQVMRRS